MQNFFALTHPSGGVCSVLTSEATRRYTKCLQFITITVSVQYVLVLDKTRLARLASIWVNVSGCNFEQGWSVWLHNPVTRTDWSGAGAFCSLVICPARLMMMMSPSSSLSSLRRHWRSCLPRADDNVFLAL